MFTSVEFERFFLRFRWRLPVLSVCLLTLWLSLWILNIVLSLWLLILFLLSRIFPLSGSLHILARFGTCSLFRHCNSQNRIDELPDQNSQNRSRSTRITQKNGAQLQISTEDKTAGKSRNHTTMSDDHIAAVAIDIETSGIYGRRCIRLYPCRVLIRKTPQSDESLVDFLCDGPLLVNQCLHPFNHVICTGHDRASTLALWTVRTLETRI